MTTPVEPIRVHEMEMVVASEPLRQVMAMVERVAATPGAVLITGETGVGKELVARAIHSYSLRCGKPWVDVNCAAIPEHLVESELFGFEKGAFSGADAAKAGLFELADKGTLFLDEIGELDPKVQVKLLRVLDGVPYYRLGGNRKVSVDVRIVAATNRPLEEAVRFGRFRRDLFHRLTQFQIRVPALRERPDDIRVLAEMFLRQGSEARFTPAALDALVAYAWPGNVRELRNVVMKVSVAACDGQVDVGDLPSEITYQPAAALGRAMPVSSAGVHLGDLERQTILRTLQQANGHQGVASKMLGISRRTLSRKLKQYRIDEADEHARDVPPPSLGAREQQYFRVDVQVPVRIRDQKGNVHEFASVNVSGGGVAMEGVKNPFELSREFVVSLQLPGGPNIESAAQIVWADTKGRAGVRFLDMTEQAHLALQDWIDAHQHQEGWSEAEK